MKKFIIALLAVFISTVVVSGPITFLGKCEIQQGQIIEIPVTVVNLQPVKAISLKIYFDEKCVKFLSGYSDNISLNYVYNQLVPNTITIGCFVPGLIPLHINDGQFFKLRFQHIRGMTELKWILQYCEYADSTSRAITNSVFENGYIIPTIEIAGKTWMAANANFGVKIAKTQSQTNNGIVEKHCYSDIDNNCSQLGGLYTWNEVMQYSSVAGSQGICPSGWHIPVLSEYYPMMELTRADTSEQIYLPMRSGTGKWRNTCAKHLRGQSGWSPSYKYGGNGDNSIGFNSIGSGSLYRPTMKYENQVYSGLYWTSETMTYRQFCTDWNFGGSGTVGIYSYAVNYCFMPYLSDWDQTEVSVRCVKD